MAVHHCSGKSYSENKTGLNYLLNCDSIISATVKDKIPPWFQNISDSENSINTNGIGFIACQAQREDLQHGSWIRIPKN